MLKKKKTIEGLIILNFKTTHKATIRQHGISNIIKSPEINLYRKKVNDLKKGAKAVQWSKGGPFMKWCLKYWTSTCLTLLRLL